MPIANLLVAGVPKAGTSSLHAWLADHPDVAASRDKETYHFVDPGTHMFGRRGADPYALDRYAAHFPDAPAAVVLESTPAYVYSREALARVPDLPSAPRCLFVVREPSAQILSLFQYFRNNWSWIPSDMTLAQFVAAADAGTHDFGGNELARDALRNAAYVDFLEPWAERLGPDRMRVETFDALRADPRGLTERVARWAGLDPAFYADYAFPRDNETYAPRWSTLQRVNVALRARLPKGVLYDAARGAYRALATRRPAGPDEDDRAVLAGLRARYREPNARLAARFGLDLGAW